MEWVELGKVVKVKPAKFNFNADDFIWNLTLDQIESNTGKVNVKKYIKFSDIGNSTFLFDQNNVLYSKLRPYLNKVICPMDKGVATSELVPLFPDPKLLDRNYFTYFLLSQEFVKLISSKVAGAKMPRVVMTDFWKILIPLPSPREQILKVEILDKIKSIIYARKKQLEKCNEYIKSAFNTLFGDPITNPLGWEVVKLGGVAEIIMGQSPDGETYNNKGIGAPLLNGPTEFGKKYPKEKQWTTNPKKFCEIGDILFCVRGATAGRMNFSDKKYCIGRGLAAIRALELVTNQYIYFILSNGYNYFQQTSNGSTFINIDKQKLSDFPIPLTNKDLQNQFAVIVAKTEAHKELLKKSLAKMETLFDCLMDKYFN